MVEIRPLRSKDIQPIAASFAELGRNKPASQYERYLVEQDSGQRIVLIATLKRVFTGYVTIVWQSNYPPFCDAGIPEIVDFNVMPKYRRQGIGTHLMDEAERRISEYSPIAGIGVGLDRDYGAAQILYIRRGYIPDGQGISWKGILCQYGDPVTVDEGLALYFTKQLK